MTEDDKHLIRAFIGSHIGEESVDDGVDLFASGYATSLFAVQLVADHLVDAFLVGFWRQGADARAAAAHRLVRIEFRLALGAVSRPLVQVVEFCLAGGADLLRPQFGTGQM